VYKPAPQRDYGYYVLPILYGDRFAARFEPARDSAGRALVIRNWWWEPEITLSDDMRIALIDCFREFLAYLESDSLTIDSQVAERSNLGWLQPN